MTVLDAHVHVWDPRLITYPWLEGAGSLDAPFLPDDYPGGVGTRVVFVEADCAPDQALDEARWVSGLAPEWPQLAGVVAAADLRSARLEAHLDALAELPLVAGVRDLLQGEPVERLAEPELRRGLAVLAERGLSFDACIRHPQLPALVALLRAVPGLRVVVDHLGKPPVDEGIASDAGRRWGEGMRQLAELPGIHVKLSGLPAETADRPAFDRNADDFLRFGLDAFGPDRSMLGSDWPVSALVGVAVAPTAWAEHVRAVTQLDSAEWEQVSAKTGARFYRLDERD